MDDMEECCCFGDGYLKRQPVKSNGLSKLVEATSDKSTFTANQRKNDFSGMEPPKSKDSSRD